jgi:hypothetical protein
MTGPTSRQRILTALVRRPEGLDDDELSLATGVRPRQQVNRICRRLASEGIVLRGIGLRGKIVNRLREQAGLAGAPAVASERGDHRSGEGASDLRAYSCDPRATLFLFPGASTRSGRAPVGGSGPSLPEALSQRMAHRLIAARAAVHGRARVDERSTMPAWRRYDGPLYEHSREAMAGAVAAGHHLMIVSGGYGAVLATEPIGSYHATFRASWWPGGVIEAAIADYLRRHRLSSVRAIAAARSEHARLLRTIDWRGAGVRDGWLLMPEEAPGATARSVRSQGEVLGLLLQGRLPSGWRSSWGLSLRTVNLVA